MPPPPRTRRPPVVKYSCVSASAAPGFDGSVGSIRSSAPGESGPGFGFAAADARALGVWNEAEAELDTALVAGMMAKAEADEGCRAAGSVADVVMVAAPAGGAEDVGAPTSAGGALVPGVRIAGSSLGATRIVGSSLAADATTRPPAYEMAWMHRPEGV